ncbi:MAG: Endoglucanase H [Candidatus Anoxychlamydiales bacterium]|nr:Endoglucanase H [Candidatus Anoxychlamydiales bacterium]NGX35402.1 Endoglucanase H [Candidatus Anoxychlamydiales bacterium]
MKKNIFLTIFIFFFNFLVFAQDDTLFFGTAIDGFPISTSKLKKIQKEIGIKPDIIVFFLMWPNKEKINNSFNLTYSLDAIDQFGAISCITWEPMFLNNSQEQTILKADIVNGKYDEYLDEFIFQIKAFKKPIIIRFAHEMNLSRYHWGVEKDEYNESSPDIYIQMFRYIVDYFKKNKVKNALFAFCPNVDSVPNTSWNKFKNYYPGDKYVDILGLDGYNWGTCASEKNLGWNSSWRSFKKTFQNPVDELRDLSMLKPIIVFETSSAEKGGNKTYWLEKAIKEAKSLDITALCWFQVNKECKWKITEKQKNILRKQFFNRKYSIKKWIEGMKK